MKYMTVCQAAQNWKISQRLVQQYCRDGRLEGAKKFGRSWAIPADAQKPTDPRKGTQDQPEQLPSPRPAPPDSPLPLSPMPLLCASFSPGHCKEYISGIQDPRLKDIALAEYHYFSGRAEEAAQRAELYLLHPDLALRLSA